MKRYFLVFFITSMIITEKTQAQNWGAPVIFDSAVTTYETYARKFSLGDTAFLVTDLREGPRYEDIESYETRTITVYRAYADNHYFINQPVVYFVHGGAWVDEYAAWYKFVAQSFTGEMGWVTVIVDYRLTSDSVFIADQYCPDRSNCTDVENRTKAAWYPDNINDVADGLQWICDSIGNHGGDPQNIFLFGHSAGGHLVSLLSTHENFTQLKPAIKGTVSMSGAYNLKQLNMAIFGDAIDQTFQGGHINNDDELNQASPGFHLNAGEEFPLFNLLHCSMEIPSLAEQKIMFKNALSMYDIPFEEQFLLGYSHVSEMVAIGDINDSLTLDIISFMASNLTQTIQIDEGWSGISSYIVPNQNSFDEIFGEQIQHVEMMVSAGGFYDPSNNVNTLGDWDAQCGYMIKVDAPVQLSIVGSLIDEPQVTLANGWNLVPVLNKGNIPADDFSGLHVGVEHINEIAGTDVYWPAYGISSLDTLWPGKAYQVLISSDR